MMVLAAAVRAEAAFPFLEFFFSSFLSLDHPSLWKLGSYYLKESSAAQGTGQDSNRASLQQKSP